MHGCSVDTTGISLACRLSDFTVSLCFSLTYTFPSFQCLGLPSCALANIPLLPLHIVPLSLALLLCTLVPRPLSIPLVYSICIYLRQLRENIPPDNPLAFPSRFQSLRSPCSLPTFRHCHMCLWPSWLSLNMYPKQAATHMTLHIMCKSAQLFPITFIVMEATLTHLFLPYLHMTMRYSITCDVWTSSYLHVTVRYCM